jgi:hypothetical protein
MSAIRHRGFVNFNVWLHGEESYRLSWMDKILFSKIGSVGVSQNIPLRVKPSCAKTLAGEHRMIFRRFLAI